MCDGTEVSYHRFFVHQTSTTVRPHASMPSSLSPCRDLVVLYETSIIGEGHTDRRYATRRRHEGPLTHLTWPRNSLTSKNSICDNASSGLPAYSLRGVAPYFGFRVSSFGFRFPVSGFGVLGFRGWSSIGLRLWELHDCMTRGLPLNPTPHLCKRHDARPPPKP